MRCVAGCFICIVLLTSCALTPQQVSPEVPPPTLAVENLDASDLMQAYGALLRARVREDDRRYTENDQFKRLQNEVAKRKLVTKKTSEEIAQGIVYLGMPKEQLMASIDGIKLSEQETFDRFLLKIYRGGERAKFRMPGIAAIFPNFWLNPWKHTHYRHRKGNEIAFTCTDNNKLKEEVIGLYVWGRTTFETYSTVTVDRSRIRTNFSPGFFNQDSAESQLYVRAGQNVPDGPQWELRGTGAGVFGSQLIRDSSSPGLLGRLIGQKTYPQLLRYLEKRC